MGRRQALHGPLQGSDSAAPTNPDLTEQSKIAPCTYAWWYNDMDDVRRAGREIIPRRPATGKRLERARSLMCRLMIS